ncbi:unnamed protein product [Caenorhabditis brenneri]
MSSIPVLRLPHLALIEVLKCWNPFELFTFAQCSEKAARVIPLAGTKNFYLSCHSYAFIAINQYVFNIAKIRQHRGYQCRNIDCAVETKQKSNFLTSFWKNEWTGFRKLCLYLSDLFQCPVARYCHTNDVTMLQFFQFAQEIVRKRNEIKILSFDFSKYGRKFSNGTYNACLRTLSRLHVTEELHVVFRSVDFMNPINLAVVPKCVHLRYAPWFTRKHLLSFENCTLVRLHETKLTNKDIDEFVNLWRSGGFSELQAMEVSSENLRHDVPIGGFKTLRDCSNRTRRIKKITGYTFYVPEGVVIQRNDGKKADMRLGPCFSHFFTFIAHSEEDILEPI